MATIPLLDPARGLSRGKAPRVSEDQLIEAYDDLLCTATHSLSRLPRGVHDFEAHSLVHDAYLRLMGSAGSPLISPSEMRFAMNRAMHDELVESARRASSSKHGGFGRRVDLEAVENELATEPMEQTFLAVHESVKKLKKNDPVNARIVTLRFFGGLTTEETAEVMGCSVTTIERKWRGLKEWLARDLQV